MIELDAPSCTTQKSVGDTMTFTDALKALAGKYPEKFNFILLGDNETLDWSFDAIVRDKFFHNRYTPSTLTQDDIDEILGLIGYIAIIYWNPTTRTLWARIYDRSYNLTTVQDFDTKQVQKNPALQAALIAVTEKVTP